MRSRPTDLRARVAYRAFGPKVTEIWPSIKVDSVTNCTIDKQSNFDSQITRIVKLTWVQ